MPRLVDAVLAKGVRMKEDGIAGMVDRIVDREEFEQDIPSSFTATLGFIFEAEPNSTFKIGTEVMSHMGKPIWFDSGSLKTPPWGRGEFVVQVQIPVLDVGPCNVALLFEGEPVWSHVVFFARRLREH
jgi:hypothetical protein